MFTSWTSPVRPRSLYLALSLVAGLTGRKRRIGFWGFFFASILFTPLISLLFLYFATPRPLPGARNGPPAPRGNGS